MSFVLAFPTLPHVNEELASFSRQIFRKVEAYVQNSGTEALGTAQDVIGAFYEQVESLASNGQEADDIEGALSILWTTILEISAQVPHDHPSMQLLTKLLSVIRTQPTPSQPGVSAAAVGLLHEFEQTWSQTFWQGLPVFGIIVHDTQSRNPAHKDDYIEINGRILSANTGIRQYSLEQWTNIQTFLLLCKTEGVMDLLLEEQS